MGFGSPKPPQVQMPPPAAHPPTLGSSQALSVAGAKNAAIAAEGMGADSTVKTSPQGDLTPQNTARTTLLGR